MSSVGLCLGSMVAVSKLTYSFLVVHSLYIIQGRIVSSESVFQIHFELNINDHCFHIVRAWGHKSQLDHFGSS